MTASRRRMADRYDVIDDFEDWGDQNDPRFMEKYDSSNGRYIFEVFTKWLVDNGRQV